MKRNLIITSIIALALVVMLVGAVYYFSQSTNPQPRHDSTAVSPNSQPELEGRVAQLILELTDAAKQRQATDELRRIGKPALPLMRQSLALANDQLRAKLHILLDEIEGKAPAIAAKPDALPTVMPQPEPPLARKPLPTHAVRKRDWQREGFTPLSDAFMEQINEGDPFNPSEPLPPVTYELLVKWTKHNPSRWQDLMDYLHTLPFHSREDAIGQMQFFQIKLTGGGMPANLPTPEQASLDLMDSIGMRLGEGRGGLRVTDINAASIAERMGLEIGDIISQINGKPVVSLEDARVLISNAENGKPLKIVVQRKGEEMMLTAPNP